MRTRRVSLIRQLVRYELDGGITYLGSDLPAAELCTMPLYMEQYVLVTQQDGPLGADLDLSAALDFLPSGREKED